MTRTQLKRIYNRGYAQVGDTEIDFLNWAIDYLIELNENLTKE